MSVDKVLALAQTIVTIQLTLPQNKTTISKTMLMKRHQRIAPLFSDEFWGYALTKSGKNHSSEGYSPTTIDFAATYVIPTHQAAPVLGQEPPDASERNK